MSVRLTGALVAALALLAALPAVAAADLSRSAQRVYDDYRADAAIRPCDHSIKTYRRTLREITPVVEEETPAFRPAVEAALREREKGAGNCAAPGDDQQDEGAGGAAGGGTGATPPAQTPAPGAGRARSGAREARARAAGQPRTRAAEHRGHAAADADRRRSRPRRRSRAPHPRRPARRCCSTARTRARRSGS